MPSPVVRFFVHTFVERPARRSGADALARALDASLPALEARARAGLADPRAGDVLRHVIGIERWGQRRLRVALGDLVYERDEHHPHKPPADRPLGALVDDLRATRAETVALARRVAAAGRAAAEVEHNSLGPLTAAGWLRYLRVHADLEVRRLRRG